MVIPCQNGRKEAGQVCTWATLCNMWATFCLSIIQSPCMSHLSIILSLMPSSPQYVVVSLLCLNPTMKLYSRRHHHYRLTALVYQTIYIFSKPFGLIHLDPVIVMVGSLLEEYWWVSLSLNNLIILFLIVSFHRLFFVYSWNLLDTSPSLTRPSNRRSSRLKTTPCNCGFLVPWLKIICPL